MLWRVDRRETVLVFSVSDLMTKATLETQGTNTLGVLLMTFAMLTTPLVDGLAKHLSLDYSPLFISWVRYAVACFIVLPLVCLKRGRRIFPSENLGAHTMRTVFLVTAVTLFFLSIARIPLATAVTAYFVSPIIAVVLSIVVLKEQFTPRKGISLILGVVGTLVILRPDSTTDAGILMAFGAGFFFALYMLATRQASKDSDPFKTLAFQCAVGTILLLPQAVLFWSAISIDDLIFFFGLGLFSAVSHILSITAFRFSVASTLAPIVYVELIGSVAVGYFAFHEIPSWSVIAGAVLIVIAGLILVVQRRSAWPLQKRWFLQQIMVGNADKTGLETKATNFRS
jgi:drug/metabolite transporter (DMT)-like permease